MKWLLWKDYRHNRLIVFTALAILLGPYLIGLGVISGGHWIKTGVHNGQAAYWTPPWREILLGAGVYSLAISQLSVALIGGNAISGERVDRSAAFLYSLPITRMRLLASKFLLALTIAAVIWLVNVTVLWCLAGAPIPPGRSQDVFMGTMNIAVTGFTLFCVAWFLSSFVASPAFDVCGALITPLLVASGISFVDWLRTTAGSSPLIIDNGTFFVWYWGICLIIAPVCFAIGTWHYLRRVEP